MAVVTGSPQQIAELNEMLVIYDANPNPVLIIGGGRVGRASARALVAREVPVHVLDLEPTGYISRHVDHVEYSGEYIVGLSLLSHATMILHRDGEREAERGGRGGERGAAATSGHDSAPRSGSADESAWLPLQLPRRSLYVLRGEARYGWAHSVPLEHEGVPAESPRKGRRLAFIWRDAPPD